MKCREARRALSRYRDEELQSTDASRVEAHLRDCPSCREHNHVLREVNDRLRIHRVIDPSPDFDQRVLAQVRVRNATLGWLDRLEQLLSRPLPRLGASFTLALLLSAVAAWSSQTPDDAPSRNVIAREIDLDRLPYYTSLGWRRFTMPPSPARSASQIDKKAEAPCRREYLSLSASRSC